MRDLFDTPRTYRYIIAGLLTGRTTRAADLVAAINACVAAGSLSAITASTFGLFASAAADDSCSITATDKTLTSPNNPWTAADVGRSIDVAGAGVAGAVLSTTIASFTGSGEVELTDAASTTVAATKTSAGGLAAWGDALTLNTGAEDYTVDGDRRAAASLDNPGLTVKATGSTTARSLANRFADTVNVLDYGAACDGVTDDAAAWTLAIAACPVNGTVFTPKATNLVSTVTLAKKVRILGVGREQCAMAGNWLISDGAAGACFEDIKFQSPTTTLFAITGRGGIDFKRCLFDPGAGKKVFTWNNDGQVPVALECIQCHMNSGKLLDCSTGGVTTFSVHIKEVSLFSFTENDQLVTSGANYAECLTYQSLVNVDPSLTRFATTARGLITCRSCIVDDASATRVFLTNGTGNTFDTFDFADCQVMQTNGSSRRFVPLPTSFGGAGVTGAASPTQAAITTGTLALSGSSHVDFFVITGSPTLVAAATYSLSDGLYEFQRKTVLFTGTTTCGGFTLNLFGILHSTSTQSVGPCAIDLVWISGAWVATIRGRSRFSAQETGSQPGVADTSGATLAQLETSVNTLKARLRTAGIIAP